MTDSQALTVYTAREAAGILRVSRSHITTLVKTGVLRPIPHTGNRVLFSARALEALIAGSDPHPSNLTSISEAS